MAQNILSLINLFPNALAAGVIIAAVCALLGVFTIVKRVVFIGITLSEVAACGIAASMWFGLQPYAGAAVLTLAAVSVLAYPFETNRIPRDAVLGVIFVFASSLSILLASRSGFGLHEIKALLYGDLILTSKHDLAVVCTALLPVLVYLILFLRPTLYTFLDREESKLLGIRVSLWEFLYFFSLGLAVSAASKVAGALLIFCYLVVSPAAALVLTRRLTAVLALAVAGAVLSTLLGLYVSFRLDLPTNQTIAAVSCGWFGVALLVRGVRRTI